MIQSNKIILGEYTQFPQNMSRHKVNFQSHVGERHIRCSSNSVELEEDILITIKEVKHN